MFNFISFSIVFLILFIVIERVVRKRANIEVKGFFYKHINRQHKWGEILIILLNILIYFPLIFYSDMIEGYYMIIGIIVLYGFRAFMEWKYEKETKRYIISVMTSICLLIYLIGVEIIL